LDLSGFGVFSDAAPFGTHLRLSFSQFQFFPDWLSDPEIAGCVVDSFIRGAELGQYSVHAYVVMSNHVHILLDPRVPLRRITGGIKGVSARDANAKLGRTEKPFWQDESFDHWIRNEARLEHVRTYIERNPVKAGLVARPEDWKWPSANRQQRRQRRRRQS
jgi:putative transposase